MTDPIVAAPTAPTTDLQTTSINTIRFLAVDAVEKADSGHPGLPMGCAPMAYKLWTKFLKHNPSNPTWFDRDRFVLSAGHGSMLLYSLLHLTGYDLPMEELKRFRQLHSKTPGHPENFVTPGVETTTGPLGQGFANGVGMAIVERFLASRFNRPDFPVVDHYTYAIVSDGDLMEGVSHEAASLAGHLGLGKLIYLYDDNEISIDGSTDLAFTENVDQRFEAYGWHVQRVEDGTDLDALERALIAARAESSRPSLISVRTIIGYGAPNKQGTADVHGSPLGEEERAKAKKNLGWPQSPTFLVPDGVYEHMDARTKGVDSERAWTQLMDAYRNAHPDLAAKLEDWIAGRLPENWKDAVPTFEPGSSMASRASSGKVLDALGQVVENLIGGSADLTGSNKTAIKGRTDFQKDNPSGAYFRFGVREHGMASICNGMVLHGGVRPYCGTFLVFTDYLRPALRLSALMGAPVIYVMTHDSIGLGEDGPTHQPVEHYAALRAIPNLNFIRPADANETAEAWKVALETTDAPTVLSLTRQKLPTLDRAECAPAAGLRKGAYTLWESSPEPEVILIATGSEVSIALEAARRLAQSGTATRVVSMPCWELFEGQSATYRAEVLPSTVTRRVSVEAGVSMGWERYVGPLGSTVALDRFGASAPYKELYEEAGITIENVVAVVSGNVAR